MAKEPKVEKQKKVILRGSGFVIDPDTSKVIASFDRKTHCLETDDPNVIKLCKKAGFKQISKSEIEEKKLTDPLYDKN